jgi:hypothetical protein
VLYVEVSNDEGSSWLTLGMKSGVNVDQLFNNDVLYVNAPQIYISDGNSKNAVQFIRGETEVPIGIRSKSEGQIRLRFENLERFHVESLVLRDKAFGVNYDLLRGSNEILFKNLPDSPERFLLRVGKEEIVVGTKETKETGIQVRMERNRLFVEAGDVIRSITITNMQGVTVLNVLSVLSVPSKNFTTDLNAPAGIYIVNVRLMNGESRIEKLRIKN